LNSDKILLILDLDETLVHATSKKLERNPDFVIFDYNIYCRPYLESFLSEMNKYFKLAVWSSASDDYVEKVTESIFPKNIDLEFVWGRSRCTPKRLLQIDAYGNYEDFYSSHYNYIKPLKKLKRKGFQLEKILIIDDTPHKSRDNYGNAIYPNEFLGDLKDDELQKLSKYLISIKDEKNVRNIEKRRWKAQIE
jgi:RNA polymerase II subunit A small phosphatase-like protein